MSFQISPTTHPAPYSASKRDVKEHFIALPIQGNDPKGKYLRMEACPSLSTEVSLMIAIIAKFTQSFVCVLCSSGSTDSFFISSRLPFQMDLVCPFVILN
jgi:hypothetical protein